jgi:hypothetical protein
MIIIGMGAVGCGPTYLKTKGRVVKDGVPFTPSEDEVFRVLFVPIPKDGEEVKDVFAAQFNKKDGTFQVAGKDLKGMPPGKYRVAFEFRTKGERLKGKLDTENSPYIFDVDSSTQEILIDLEKPPAAQ